MKERMMKLEMMIGRGKEKIKKRFLCRRQGIDGILVAIGLCVIGLVLCVILKDPLTDLINTIVTEMTNYAKGVLV